MKQLSSARCCWLLLLLSWQGALGCGVGSTQKKAGPPVVTYCDLIKNPEKYDGKEVTVNATYLYGFEWQEMLCLECQKAGRTWLEFDEDLSRESKAELKKFPDYQGTVNAIFTGTFQSSKGSYGNGSYRFQFLVRKVSHAEVISKNGLVPEQLPLKVRKKICGAAAPSPASSH